MRHLLSLIVVLLLGIGAARAQSADDYWFSKVEPILDKSCLKCHAGVRQAGGLDLRSLQTILKGGEHGPAVVSGKPEQSKLVQYVLKGAPLHMPPDPKKQLSDEAIETLKTWVTLLGKPAPPPREGTPPAHLSPTATIDWYLQTDWKYTKTEPARKASDTAFARRLYLDLAGRLPTPEEVKQFVGDYHGDKRDRLAQKLLASDDYVRHFREVFTAVLMGRGAGSNTAWNTFLEEAFRINRPWNEVVRDLLVARPTESTRRGAVWFLAARNNSYQAIAEAVAPVVFGMKIGCAQCHNHPLAWEIEQRHYWGLVAAFNRGKNIDTPDGTRITESAIGGFINFSNLKKESQPAALVFLNGKSVAERVPAPEEKEVESPALYVVPPAEKTAAVPKFSRREAFANAVTTENPLLARAFVNRVWAKLMGRGLVAAVDQLDSKHRPSHPELLAYLSKDFEKSGYDIQRLIRTIVGTRAYQLDITPTGKSAPHPDRFARALEKPLTAEQLLRSLQVATGSKAVTPEQERAFIAAFPEVMPESYNPSLQQALFLTNSPVVDQLLKPAEGNTTARLLTLPTPSAQVTEAFRLVLGRAPDPAEQRQCEAFLARGPKEKGVQNLVWALVTSAEFLVNH